MFGWKLIRKSEYDGLKRDIDLIGKSNKKWRNHYIESCIEYNQLKRKYSRVDQPRNEKGEFIKKDKSQS